MSSRPWQLIALIFFVLQTHLAIAASSCDRPSVLPLPAHAIQITEPLSTGDVIAGKALRIKWKFSSDALMKLPTTCRGRIVVLFGFDGDVRFQAGPFLGLAPGSPGLYGIDGFSSESRVFFELSETKSQQHELLKSNEFSFVFLRRLRFGDGRRPIAL
jgi:hypothetical protein